MKYQKGEALGQKTLLPDSIEELVGEENPVLVIEAFVEQLNLEILGLKRWRPERTGRPAYDPRDMLKLYIYGYLNRIRSSRCLMRECRRNIEVFYLLRRVTPDFRTISDFRKENAAAVKQVFKAFEKICMELGLYGRNTQAIDGTKIRAVNGRKNMYNEEILKEKLRRIEENAEKYLKELEARDQEESESEEYTGEEIREKLAKLSQRKEKYEAYLRELEETGETQKLTTDPEARLMKMKEGYGCCYNVQTAVDQKYHLIANYEVTNACNDVEQLSNMAENTAKLLETETLHVIADKGYDSQEEILKCVENGIIPHVGMIRDEEERLIPLEYRPAKITEDIRSSTKPEDIQKCLHAGILPACYEGSILSIEVQKQGQVSCFRRDLDDTVTCPMGQTLTKVREDQDGSRHYQNRAACTRCKNRCKLSKNHKVVKFGPATEYVPVLIYGRPEQSLLEYPPSETPYNAFVRMERQCPRTIILHIKDDPSAQKLRMCLSEHPFGTVKWHNGAHYLLCKGMEKASAELGLSFLAYNMRRAIHLIGVPELVRKIREISGGFFLDSPVFHFFFCFFHLFCPKTAENP